MSTSAIDRHLAAARSRIRRVAAAEASELRRAGALFIDTRPAAQRIEHGEIPEAVVIERNHLEWRLDPTGDHRHPAVVAHGGPIVVFCQEGYASSLAVAALADLGVADVYDLIDGFEGWIAAGLPTALTGGAR